MSMATKHFENACRVYDTKEYDRAFSLFKKIPQKTPAVWYNMGNCSYHMGHESEALVYWHKAGYRGTKDISESCRYNIKRVCEKNGTSPVFVDSPKKSFEIPLLVWQLMLVVLLGFMVVWGTKLARRKRWYVMSVLFSALVCITGILFWHYRAQWYPKALVIKDAVTLYAGPAEHYETVGTVHVGNKVTLQQYQQGWYKVAAQGQVGWLVGTTIAKLDTDD